MGYFEYQKIVNLQISPQKMNALSPTTTLPSTYPLSFHHRLSSPYLYLPSLPFNRRLRLRHSFAASSPPPPPPSGPPPDKDPVRLKGAVANLSRFQDKVRIFFAVLFWLSLFFWASAWDGRNDGGGGSNKGSRFRR